MIAQQRGMAVLVVLLLITLMTLLAVTAGDRFTRALRQAGSERFMQQSGWTLRGAEEWLMQQTPARVASGTQTLQLQEQLIQYRWRDRQACFNLNALAEKRSLPDPAATPATAQADQPPEAPVSETPQGATGRRSAAERIFLQLLANLNVAQPEGRKILSTLQRALQAGPLDDVSQLREPVFAIDAALWQRLAPQLCVLPSSRLRININGLTAASLPLFSALFNGTLSPRAAETLLQNRPDTGWEDLSSLAASALKPQDSGAVSTLFSAAVTQSEAWELLMWIQEDRRSNSLRSHIQRSGERLIVTDRLYGLSE